MNPPDDTSNEQDRIRAVYQQWLARERISAYAWHRPDVMQQGAERKRVLGHLLATTIGTDLTRLRALDVGCGSGGFLRQLIDWGADPTRLAGTEYQPERLDLARLRTAPGVTWHLGDLDFIADGAIELAVANTVFSSILDPESRARLAADMWRTVMPGGWCMVFDFRYNNPNNKLVRRVLRDEFAGIWRGDEQRYRTVLLAPPIARRLAQAPLLCDMLCQLAPVLRSHFFYMVRKPG